MAKTLEFFFDVVSPTAYLAWTQLPKLVERTGAMLEYRPFFLGGVMQATGNRPPATVQPKGVWMNRDLQRFAARYGVPLGSNPHFPMNTLPVMRGAIKAKADGDLETYLAVFFPASWVEGVDVGDLGVYAALLSDNGFDADAYLAAVQTDEVKDALKKNTGEAIERGAFGSPTFFVGNEMFFGQDRLDFVEEELAS